MGRTKKKCRAHGRHKLVPPCFFHVSKDCDKRKTKCAHSHTGSVVGVGDSARCEGMDKEKHDQMGRIVASDGEAEVAAWDV